MSAMPGVGLPRGRFGAGPGSETGTPSWDSIPPQRRSAAPVHADSESNTYTTLHSVVLGFLCSGQHMVCGFSRHFSFLGTNPLLTHTTVYPFLLTLKALLGLFHLRLLRLLP